jgi:hypothetical protein
MQMSILTLTNRYSHHRHISHKNFARDTKTCKVIIDKFFLFIIILVRLLFFDILLNYLLALSPVLSLL